MIDELCGEDNVLGDAGERGCSYIMYCAASRIRMQREPDKINTIVCYRVLIDSSVQVHRPL